MTTTPTEDLPPGIAAPPQAPSGANPAPPPTVLCANCGTPLLGDVCYACGQPVKGLVRHLGSILHDVADTIFNIDSRIFRTLVPLYFRPGWLSNEYFAGRRVRYVTPFRLYFFLSVAAFLLMQVSLDTTFDLADTVHFEDGKSSTQFADAKTVEEVEKQRDEALAGLEAARAASGAAPGASRGIAVAEKALRRSASARIHEIKRDAKAEVEETIASSEDKEKDKSNGDDSSKRNDDDTLSFNGKAWDPQTNPIRVAWLPDFANARLNVIASRMKTNIGQLRRNPKPVILGAVASLPQVLFFLMPLFALMLKLFYLFKRRLYMEHLIVALHSHSFIFQSLFFLVVAGLVKHWAHTNAGWLEAPLGWLMFFMGWWIPIYLLIMQKKVYRQGWFMTIVKYGVIGIGYLFLISIGVAAAFVVSMATT
ncbi:MAG TPA: DUF3667 domain-containing protein [Rudaea sp.]